MIQIEYLPLVLTGLSISTSIFYYAMVLRNQNKTRQTQMTLQLIQSRTDLVSYQKYWEIIGQQWDTFEEYREKLSPQNNPEHAAARITLFSFYDSIGVLVKDKMVNVDMVYRLLSVRIISMWFKYETTIKENRKQEEGPGKYFMDEFEFLAEEMIKITIKKGERLPTYYLHPTSELLNKYNR